MSPDYFFPWLNDLSGEMRLLPVHSGASGAMDMDGLVAEVAQAVATCGAGPVFLLGHSFGAVLAAEYIRRSGSARLSGLILLSWIHNAAWMQDFLAMNEDYREPEVPAGLGPDQAMAAAMVAQAPLYFPEHTLAAGRRVLSGVRYNKTLSAAIFSGYLAAFDVDEVLRTCDVPVLSIHGAADRVVSGAHVLAGVRLLPRVTHQDIATAGHFPFVDCPGQVNSLIREFVGAGGKALAQRNDAEHGRLP